MRHIEKTLQWSYLTQDLQKKSPHSKTCAVGEIWTPRAAVGPYSHNHRHCSPLPSTALQHTPLLYLLLCADCRREERDQADFSNSDSISMWASLRKIILLQLELLTVLVCQPSTWYSFTFMGNERRIVENCTGQNCISMFSIGKEMDLVQ